MPPDREGAPQAGGKRKNTEPGELRPPIPQKAVPTSSCKHPDKAHGASAGLAAFTHHMTQASLQLDQIEFDRKALRLEGAALRAHIDHLRLKNAALTVRLEVATKTVKRSKALAVRYYDLCVGGGVDLQVLDGVDAQVLVGQQSDEEAEEHAEEVEEEQQHAPP